MTKSSTFEIFDQIYDTNLVFEKDCYKLCGDAHCCNFSRYKSKFSFMSQKHVQELPLLPGEFEYLEHKGYLEQFGTYTHRVVPFDFETGSVTYNALVSEKEGCACNHATRTTICRLYPLLPQFSSDGVINGVEDIGIYEEIEKIEGLAKACKLDSIPFDQLSAFLRLAATISKSREMMFHIEAFRAAKSMAANALVAQKEKFPDESTFSLFEMLALRNKLFSADDLKSSLQTLHANWN